MPPWAHVSLGGVGLALCTAVALASGAIPPSPRDVIASKAYSALERNCASCHQAGLLAPGTAAGGGLSNILALDQIAQTPGLVRPGLPDASLIYNVSLTLERHLDAFNDPALAEPQRDDIQAIRDWIMEQPDRRCPAVAGGGGREAGQAMARALEGLPAETARLARFVSGRHLMVRCGEPEVVERARQVLADVARGQTAGGMGLEPVDAEGHLWRISLREIGLAPAAWDELAQGYAMAVAPGLVVPEEVRAATGTQVPVLPMDWVADALARVALQPVPPWLEAGGLRGRRADIATLAAELWLSVDEVRARLDRGLPSGLVTAGRRLAVGEAVERVDFDRVGAHLSGREVAVADAAGPLALALWSDKAVYQAGEVGVLSVVANKDCYLTLIGVDRNGRATVLFPNELEPSNFILAGEARTVPGEKAGYRLRFRDKGREHVVGVCSQTHRAPEGIVHDYERLRFTVLGDWQLFLREPPALGEARRDDAAMDVPREKPGERRRGRAVDAMVGAQVEAADVQTRTAIVIEVR